MGDMEVGEAVASVVGVGGGDAAVVGDRGEVAHRIVAVGGGERGLVEAIGGGLEAPEGIVGIGDLCPIATGGGVAGLHAGEQVALPFVAVVQGGLGGGVRKLGDGGEAPEGVVGPEGGAGGIGHGGAAAGGVVGVGDTSGAGVAAAGGLGEEPTLERIVGVGGGVAVEAGAGGGLALGVVGGGLGLAFGEGAAGAAAHVIVGVGGGAPERIGLADLAAGGVVGVGALQLECAVDHARDGGEATGGIVAIGGALAFLVDAGGAAAVGVEFDAGGAEQGAGGIVVAGGERAVERVEGGDELVTAGIDARDHVAVEIVEEAGLVAEGVDHGGAASGA